ncbi:hypothetical protein NEOLEDRAFT_1082225 [Neolentinus lepideus HHB14362 ss-1]|uniref:Transmembrane protein n=1 Tax=Neolentinus lepideus HHB14362 ss-1 TaxID=1314782 RepID=A0A165VYC6_9AGAM|nr:hypothetical protein NEOLEDRAFT_1082225 [Neolentinus lepideus HHB14362 ss-1]
MPPPLVSGTTIAARTYSAPTTFALTNDKTLNTVLAEIPFFSVGILAFAVVTFLTISRRLHLVSAYVIASAVIGFLAAILDLANLLNGINNNINTFRIKLQAVTSIVVAREILFSISVGLRFMFFWAFVAERPRGEGTAPSASEGHRPNFIHMNSDVTLHSGSWYQWGLIGMILKWGLLGVTVTIPILQMIWRIVTMFSTFGPVYDADGTMEIVGSALFLSKLLLNAWLSPDETRWRVLCHYLVVMVALGINLAIGAADLLCFAFSETVLGRFLQALELYILMLYMLVSTFMHHPPTPPAYSRSRSSRGRPISDFRGLPTIAGINPRGSTFHVSPPIVSTPSSSAVLVEDGPVADNGRPQVSRQSTASRMSSWLMARSRVSLSRLRVQSDRDQDQLWDRNESEKGYAQSIASPYAGASVRSPDGDESMVEPKQSAKWMDPVYSSVMQGSGRLGSVLGSGYRAPDDEPGDPVAVATPGLVDREDISRPDSNVQPQASRERTPSPRPSMAPTMPSYYGAPSVQRSPSPQSLPPAPSPIYGLNNNMPDTLMVEPSFRPTSIIESQRSSGISALLRQQQELDRSIAQLRLFSPRNTMQSEFSTETKDKISPESASLRSEFSLSKFPVPPWQDQDDDGNRTPRARPASISEEVPTDLVPPQMPAAIESRRQQLSFPSTTRGTSIDSTNTVTDLGANKFDSHGTQYDVTSFIGNLTVPGLGVSPVSTSGLSSIESGGSEELEAEIVTRRELSTSLQAVVPSILGPLSRPANSENETANPPLPRTVTFATPDISSSSSSTPYSRPPPPMFMPTGAVVEGKGPTRRRGAVGLPPRPRLLISEPRIRESANGQDSFRPGAFEDPRPAPSFMDTGDSSR